MSDNSLPKPVLPATPPQAKAPSGQPQMPPSARVPAPLPAAPLPAAPLPAAPALSPLTPSPIKTPPAASAPVTSASPLAQQPPQTAGKPPAGQSKPNAPQAANIKKSPFRFLPFIIGGLVLVAGVVFGLTKILGNKAAPVEVDRAGKTSQQAPAGQAPAANAPVAPAAKTTITYWGLWEPDTTVREVLTQFETSHPEITVNYVKQSHQDYRERLQTAVASGNGPDVFRFHASWTPMLGGELAAMPQSVMSASQYQQTFYPAAASMLNLNGQIMGIPLMYDGLGLYYNKEMLTAAGEQPPKTWAELKSLAARLTVRSGTEIKRAGVALGNASNVEHFSDILGLLMLQNGADLTAPTSQEANDALTFYTNFVVQNKVWNAQLPSSTVAFARGDVAMMIAPSWRAHEVASISPELSFGIAQVPVLGEAKIAWASFWAEGVSSKSKSSAQAWELIKYLSSKDVQQQLYSAQSQTRSFGEIYSRVDLADGLADDERVSPYLQDAPNAQGWYLNSYTHDNGLNDLLIKYYEDAVTSVLEGTSVEDALQVVSQGTSQILRQYKVE